MANYECKHCGAGANSKCAHQRTVFPDDQFDSMLSHCLKYKVQPTDHGSAWVQLSVHVVPDRMDKTNEVEQAISMIASLTPEQIKAYSCDHEWAIVAGETCMFGCCGGLIE